MTDTVSSTDAPLPDVDALPTDPDAIEEEIIAARARLAQNVDALADEANPATLARKGGDKVKSFFVESDGAIRTDRVAKTAAAVVGFLVLRGIIRRGS